MARTNQERFQQAVDYLKTLPGEGGTLATEVVSATGGRKEEFGRRISLEGAGYHFSGTPEQHGAVKALTLCELAFNTFPFAPSKDIKGMDRVQLTDADLTATRKLFKGKTQAVVDEEIKQYMRAPHLTLQAVCDAARRVRSPAPGAVPIHRMKRSDDRIGGGGSIVCYDGVKNWLFAAGMVSRRWLVQQGLNLDANTTNQIFGPGTVVDPDDWDSIEAGYFWSIEKKLGGNLVDSTTCHWGVSLGRGVAVATNNELGSPAPKGRLVQMTFTEMEGVPPGKAYGIFSFADICDVLNRNFKYRPDTSTADPAQPDSYIQVKKWNPLLLNTLF